MQAPRPLLPLALVGAVLVVLAVAGCGGGGQSPAEKYALTRAYDLDSGTPSNVEKAACTKADGNRYQCRLTMYWPSDYLSVAAAAGRKRRGLRATGVADVICDGSSCQMDREGITITHNWDPLEGVDCGTPDAPSSNTWCKEYE